MARESLATKGSSMGHIHTAADQLMCESRGEQRLLEGSNMLRLRHCQA